MRRKSSCLILDFKASTSTVYNAFKPSLKTPPVLKSEDTTPPSLCGPYCWDPPTWPPACPPAPAPSPPASCPHRTPCWRGNFTPVRAVTVSVTLIKWPVPVLPVLLNYDILGGQREHLAPPDLVVCRLLVWEQSLQWTMYCTVYLKIDIFSKHHSTIN